MTERDDKSEDKESAEPGAVRNYVDDGKPGSEADLLAAFLLNKMGR